MPTGGALSGRAGVVARTLTLAEDLELPLDAVTQTFAILAKRGSGKTYTAAVLVEELVGAGLPVVVVDPIGVWWGLRAGADGTSEGLPIVIVGGEHGDLGLPAGAAIEALADVVIEQRMSVVLDLGELSKRSARSFLRRFAERLYHRNRQPLHLVLDEADMWAPQSGGGRGTDPEVPRLLGAIEDIVRRGRARGLGATLITQRPAVLHKDVLTQAEVLIAMKMTGPRDVAAIDEWVRLHAEEEEARTVKASLPALPVGTAWLWSPGWLGELRKVQIRARRTFDSSATPKVGEVRIEPQRLTAVDLHDLSGRLAELGEQTAETEPAALQKRIRELERQLRERPPPEPVPVLDDRSRQLLEDLVDAARSAAGELAAAVRPIDEALRRAGRGTIAPRIHPDHPDHADKQRARDDVMLAAARSSLPRAQTALLATLVHAGRPLTRLQLSVLSGYSIKSSSFANALGALRSARLATGSTEISATDTGRATMPDVPTRPTGPALVDYWLAQLGRAERNLLTSLLQVYPRSLTADELAELAGYSRTSSSFSNALGRLRSLGLASGRADGITANAELGQAFGSEARRAS